MDTSLLIVSNHKIESFDLEHFGKKIASILNCKVTIGKNEKKNCSYSFFATNSFNSNSDFEVKLYEVIEENKVSSIVLEYGEVAYIFNKNIINVQEPDFFSFNEILENHKQPNFSLFFNDFLQKLGTTEIVFSLDRDLKGLNSIEEYHDSWSNCKEYLQNNYESVLIEI